MLKVAVRTDASSTIGAGHFMRCLALVEELSLQLSEQNIKLTATFISAQTTPFCESELLRNEFNLVRMPSSSLSTLEQDAISTQKVIAQLGQQHLLIVDSYAIQTPWYQEEIKAYCERILVIDDLANRTHRCDFLLDQTLDTDGERYTGLVPEECLLLTGKSYMLLRHDFVKWREKAMLRRKSMTTVKEILINMGGSDAEEINKLVVEAVHQVNLFLESSLKVTLVIPSKSKSLSYFQSMSANSPWLKVLTDVNNMTELMYQADIAIGASGSSAWERCCLGLPTLAVELADNQALVLDKLSSKGAIINLGKSSQLTVNKVKNAISNLIDSQTLYYSMVQKAAACCDGRGAKRALKALNLSNVYLRAATEQDKQTLFHWQSQKIVRKYSRTNHEISYEEHCQWYEQVLKDPSRHLFIITERWADQSEVAVGMLRLDQHDKSYEVSILIDPKQHGRGLAELALYAIPDKLKSLTITATVHPDNLPSQALFSKAGFQRVADDLFILNQVN